jgi:putative ABC transport system permease protein
MILSFVMALRSISANKLRSVLTMLGIIIGVMALVVLVSLVSGATESVTEAVAGLGSSMLTVSVSDDHGSPVTLDTLDEWMDTRKDLGKISAYAMDGAMARYNRTTEMVSVCGTTVDYYDIQALQLSIGRWITRTDLDNHSYVCVLNETAAVELIGYVDCVGEEITLNAVPYTVVGVLQNSEDNLTSFIAAGSMTVYLPYTNLVRLSGSVTERITSFYVMAPEGSTVEDTQAVMNQILLDRFRQDEDAFEIQSQNVLEDTMNSITSVLSILLGGIAAISLVVGGIGIMNIMLVTVTERTREIGIRKAIGATRGIILTQFLMEAVVLCMLGCCLGIFLSWAILQLVTTVVSSLDMSFSLDGGVVLVAVVFCFFIGVIFGLYPANKAAKMKPIDALHYGG